MKNIFQNYFEKKKNKKIKVIVGLSGGIDSAYSAYLLKRQGFDVEAFYMRNWDTVKNKELNNILTDDDNCNITQDMEDAKLIAGFLDIPFHKVNLVDEYWNLVFKTFIEELKNGITPNPDIMCNKYIKFDKFLEYVSKEIGEFDYIATGHYAKIVQKGDQYYLAKAKDSTKDQTYFLAEIQKELLPKIKFPLQDLLKSEVRENALKLNFPNAIKKDSVGICFIGERNFVKFLSNYIDTKVGDIINIDTK